MKCAVCGGEAQSYSVERRLDGDVWVEVQRHPTCRTHDFSHVKGHDLPFTGGFDGRRYTVKWEPIEAAVA